MDRFDLEKEIESCRQVIDELQFVYEEAYDGVERWTDDDLANVLLGIITVYERKFVNLHNVFTAVHKLDNHRDKIQ